MRVDAALPIQAFDPILETLRHHVSRSDGVLFIGTVRGDSPGSAPIRRRRQRNALVLGRLPEDVDGVVAGPHLLNLFQREPATEDEPAIRGTDQFPDTSGVPRYPRSGSK